MNASPPDRAPGEAVFSDISERYDLVNKIITFGRDTAWRRRGIAELPPGVVLDLGSGTGAASGLFGDRSVVAFDPVWEMLELNDMPLRCVGIGEKLPFADDALDGVFSAYVIRNVRSVAETLAEMKRVLRPGGAAVMIDAGRPSNSFLRKLHQAGSAVALPLVGSIFGAREEYAYLNKSLDSLPQPEVLYADGPLELEKVWRMGPFGFMYGAVLRA